MTQRKVLLIDADSTIPNLALMKLSTYYKSIGCSVELLKLNLPYYPNKKKTQHSINTEGYYRVACSVIFEGNIEYIVGDNIIFGGTGTDNISGRLPEIVEQMQPDYSIYPDNKVAYGFITRGCIRDCYFCKVKEKEGHIRLESSVDNIATRPITEFMDNNILAFQDHKAILQEIVDKKIKCSFNQGLDIRLIDAENSQLLSNIRYRKEYKFAFDNINLANEIDKKLELMKWRKDWRFKFYVYVNPDMTLKDTVERIKFLKIRKILPYFMRDISCYTSEYRVFYSDLAAWCNQPWMFKENSFEEFLRLRYTKDNKIKYSLDLWKANQN